MLSGYKLFIYLIVATKLVFIILSVSNLVLKSKNQGESKRAKEILYWRDRVEFFFIILMSLLLIYLFNPRSNNLSKIDRETQYLLYLYGFIMIITAKWADFISEAKWFSNLQEILAEKRR